MVRDEAHPEAEVTFEVADRLGDRMISVHARTIMNNSFLVNYFSGDCMSGNLRERGQVREAELLRGDDAADGVAARQDDAAMIHYGGRRIFG